MAAAMAAGEACGPEGGIAGGGQLALAADLAPAPRSAGRPKGAASKRTREFLSYLEARPDLVLPGVFLAETYSRPVEELLIELGLANTAENRMWAAERRLDAAKALAPYVHERRPIAVSIDDKYTVELVVRDARTQPATALPGRGMRILDVIADEIGVVGDEEEK